MKSAMRHSSNSSQSVRFPDLPPNSSLPEEPLEGDYDNSSSPQTNGLAKEPYWQARTKDTKPRANGGFGGGRKRQKSLSEALQSIRYRRGSVTENALELTEALKAPVSPRLVVSANDSWTDDWELTFFRSSAGCGT